MKELRVLLADDDRDFAESLEEILTMKGMYVECVSDGQAAIDRVIQNHIDVLVLDLKMPRKSGLQVYEELTAKGIDIPAILVTAYDTTESGAVQKFSELSKGGIMSKPINPSELVDRINSLGRQGNNLNN